MTWYLLVEIVGNMTLVVRWRGAVTVGPENRGFPPKQGALSEAGSCKIRKDKGSAFPKMLRVWSRCGRNSSA